MILGADGKPVGGNQLMSPEWFDREARASAARVLEVQAEARVGELRRAVLGPDASAFCVGKAVTVRIPRRFGR